VDDLIKDLAGPLLEKGVLGITTLLFLGLYLWQSFQRSVDRKDFNKAMEAMQNKNDALHDSRFNETRILTQVVSEFSHTVPIVLAAAQKGAR
jgi:hypothetical protein